MNRLIFLAIYYLMEFLKYAIIANAVLSFLPVPRHSPIVRLLYQITEPVLTPIRNLLFKSAIGRNMMIDVSPVIAIALIYFVQQIAARILLFRVPLF